MLLRASSTSWEVTGLLESCIYLLMMLAGQSVSIFSFPPPASAFLPFLSPTLGSTEEAGLPMSGRAGLSYGVCGSLQGRKAENGRWSPWVQQSLAEMDLGIRAGRRALPPNSFRTDLTGWCVR